MTEKENDILGQALEFLYDIDSGALDIEGEEAINGAISAIRKVRGR